MKKRFDPMEGIKQVPYDASIVLFIDKLIEVRNKNGSTEGTISTEKDWETMQFLLRGWKILYPEEAYSFNNHMKILRRDTKNNGLVKEGNALIQHQMEIPETLYKMIKALFPVQKWDKKFVTAFTKRFPQLAPHE